MLFAVNQAKSQKFNLLFVKLLSVIFYERDSYQPGRLLCAISSLFHDSPSHHHFAKIVAEPCVKASLFQGLSRLQGVYANRNSLTYSHSLLGITVI
jgi:hypothetical protein